VLTDLDERGLLQPLSDDVVAMSTADVSSGLTDLVTIDDRPTAVWINVDVKSLVWYRPAIFDERGLSIPSSLDELGSLTSANRVSADGVAPWCVTMGAGAATGWVGTDWVENFVLRRFGPEVYDRWTTGQIRFDDERIVAVFDELDALLRRPGAIAGGARAVLNTPWEREAEGVLSTPPTCLMAAQADFLRREFPTDTVIGQDGDIDFFVLPPVTAGDADPLVVGGTVAAPLVLGPDVDAAMTLLSGVDLAERLDRTGVFLSPHLRVDRAALVSPASVRLFELLEAAPVVRFDGSDLMPGAVGTGSFWAGMRAFSGGESIGTVIDTIQAGWSTTPEGGSG
jgi:alpha-glucoside transport system substrate-binding protein